MGIIADRIVWVQLRDFIPLTRKSYRDKEKFRNAAMEKWLAENARETDKSWALEIGQQRGPGIYDIVVNRSWIDLCESMLKSAAGMMAQINPVKIISDNCSLCELNTACRWDMYNPLDVNEKRKLEKLTTTGEEDHGGKEN
jgi:hypothetical protein